jgi:hypothetical protein
MIKRCEYCGREFEARRSTARFCSAACRQRHHRALAYSGTELPRPTMSMSKEDALQIVTRAHEVASDMSRASMLVSAPLCLSLAKVSAAIEDALESEGL